MNAFKRLKWGVHLGVVALLLILASGAIAEAALSPERGAEGRVVRFAPSLPSKHLRFSRDILKRVSKLGHLPVRPTRVHVDTSTKHEDPASVKALSEAFKAIGYQDGANLKFVLDSGAAHDENAWAKRLPDAFRFVFSGYSARHFSNPQRRF